jgi:hypothetical protein
MFQARKMNHFDVSQDLAAKGIYWSGARCATIVKPSA